MHRAKKSILKVNLLFLDQVYQGVSLSETKINKLLKKEHSLSAIKLSNKILCKIYPAASRTNSSNYDDPTNFWNHGFQMGIF